MKGQKKLDVGLRDVGRWTIAALVSVFCQPVFCQSFSEGKSLHQLREAVRSLTAPSRLTAFLPQIRVIGQTNWNRQTETLPAVFLPRWSAERLPFFCRIEHRLAKGSAVPFKFRLGSVEYVDWLEGKGDLPQRHEGTKF